MKPITYLALDVGRGHLMMASTMHQVLAMENIPVQTFTTSETGRQFYHRLTGIDAHLLSPWFRFAWHNYDLQVGRSTLLVLHYFSNPVGFIADLMKLWRPLSRTSLVLNDVHPVGLLLPFLPGKIRHTPVIHILSENAWAALRDIVNVRGFGLPGRIIDHIAHGGHHVIVNTLDLSKAFTTVNNITYLPPLLPREELGDSSLTHELRLSGTKRLFVAYLNPLFRDPLLIQALIDAARRHGAYLYLVSEYAAIHCQHLKDGYATIVSCDSHIRQRLSGADLFISGAGLAAPWQAYVTGTRFLGLVSQQPEHVKNAQAIEKARIGRCMWVGDDLGQAIDQVLAMDVTPHPHMTEMVTERWCEIIRTHRNL